MKKIGLIIIVLLTGFSIDIYCQYSTDDIVGKWYTEEKESIVEIYKRNNKYYGKLAWLEEPYEKDGKPKLDKENPDINLRNRKLEGLEFMFDFEFNGKDTWKNGRIYNARDGRTYTALIQLDGKDILKLRGYVGFEWLGKNSIWQRVE